MKKIRLIQWLALLLAGALLLGFAACNSGGKEEPTTAPLVTTTDPFEFPTEPPTTETVATPGFWSIEIRGVPNITSFNSHDAQYLPKVRVEMISTNIETGLTSKVTYGGVTLRSLLMTFCGVQYVSSVTVSSINGSSAVYNPVMAMAEDTILAWEVDGAPIDADPPLRLCPRSGTAEMLIRQVSSLNVIPDVAPTTTTYATPPMGYTNDYNYRTTTRRTTWATYDPNPDPNLTVPTMPPATDGQGNPITSPPPTTTEATTTTTTTTRTYTTYIYVQPTTSTRSTASTASTKATSSKPDWWPDDVEWLG